MDDRDQGSAGAREQLDAGAHALRNDVATLRMAAGLVDDAEVAASIRAALDDLQVRLERAVAAARIELGKRPADVVLDAGELVRLGTARARREGTVEPVTRVEIGAGTVAGPGPWLERLVADLVHADADAAWIDALAAACGVRVRLDGRVAVLQPA